MNELLNQRLSEINKLRALNDNDLNETLDVYTASLMKLHELSRQGNALKVRIENGSLGPFPGEILMRGCLAAYEAEIDNAECLKLLVESRARRLFGHTGFQA
jgi:hypothetical protein